MTNTLYYGDNLHVLREHVASESVDLIYLDPPFNSNGSSGSSGSWRKAMCEVPSRATARVQVGGWEGLAWSVIRRSTEPTEPATCHTPGAR
jgi:hypothetical protein